MLKFSPAIAAEVIQTSSPARTYYRGIQLSHLRDYDPQFDRSRKGKEKIWVTPNLNTAYDFLGHLLPGNVVLEFQLPQLLLNKSSTKKTNFGISRREMPDDRVFLSRLAVVPAKGIAHASTPNWKTYEGAVTAGFFKPLEPT
ncbi:MAG: hypothetical protein K1X64_09680 [Myxococcaceae bacterium]|nr:hypothetical protein [Myxococcaceae bacterium]